MYRLDRNYGTGSSFEDADKDSIYWRSKSPLERLRAMNYLNSIAYCFDVNNPPKMDKTYFKTRAHKH